jgi:hypothetical protein
MPRIARWTLFATLTASGCGGGGDAVGPDADVTPAGTKRLTASHDGAAWTASVRLGAFNQGGLTIAGHDGAGRNLNIAALRITGPGTYALGPGNAAGAVATWVDGTGQYSSAASGGSGTITLTAASLTRVAGTFSFVASSPAASTGQARTVTITNGAFDLSNP